MAEKTFVHTGGQIYRVDQSKESVDNQILTALQRSEPAKFAATQVLGSESGVNGRLFVGHGAVLFTTEHGV
ncbi:hypothetical protein [Arthrobacter sp. MMS18-M83]|uniref:hypothetical protein n=1 Tax=Arthrobacter sp. MMS18-M83 TaxID=2996261 RepID=UPI00227C83D6|nr:hypothetical protein [Arthrobacter sp. MMS18-M83]WAH97382.1 hypothetical protein OW521_00265 [Arthrobacter sp. MMS18-M83]